MRYFIDKKNGYSVIVVPYENGLKSFTDQDPRNTDYQAYLAWVAEGNTAEEWQPE